MAPIRAQNVEKVNVWCAIWDNKIIGPFFFLTNVNGQNYLEMLQQRLVPTLNVLGYPHYFQQDGAPCHFAIVVRSYLDDLFPRRWIGRGGSINWAARSPDLTPLDFFLWGHLKHKVYQTPITDLNHLMVSMVQLNFFFVV